ncbi:hypothetical protein BJ912DRAFT_1043408 [Pholiota molesta]|nr:hypothetical protein BJ912DRAFT_1043408 [Pholiota molesta]
MTLTILSGLSPYSSELGLLRPEFVDIRQPKSRLGNRKLLHPTSHRKQLTTPLIVRSEVQGGVPNTLPKSPAARGCRRMWAYDVASALDFAQDGGGSRGDLYPANGYQEDPPPYSLWDSAPVDYSAPVQQDSTAANWCISSGFHSLANEDGSNTYYCNPPHHILQRPHSTHPPNYDGVNEPTIYEDPYALTGSDAHQHIMSTE